MGGLNVVGIGHSFVIHTINTIGMQLDYEVSFGVTFYEVINRIKLQIETR